MIDKAQPMRETLSDTVDFINDNLAIGEIEEGIGALNNRVSALENFINSENVGIVVGTDVIISPFQAQHFFIEVPLPNGVTNDDIIVCIPSGSLLSNSIEYRSITAAAQGITRFVNYVISENSVIFHWYANNTPDVDYLTYFTGIVFYKGRSTE